MTQHDMNLFNEGYNEGFKYAVQLMASKSLRIIDARPIDETDKEILSQTIKLQAKWLLQERVLVPYDYEVLTGKAKPVELNFDL